MAYDYMNDPILQRSRELHGTTNTRVAQNIQNVQNSQNNQNVQSTQSTQGTQNNVNTNNISNKEATGTFWIIPEKYQIVKYVTILGKTKFKPSGGLPFIKFPWRQHIEIIDSSNRTIRIPESKTYKTIDDSLLVVKCDMHYSIDNPMKFLQNKINFEEKITNSIYTLLGNYFHQRNENDINKNLSMKDIEDFYFESFIKEEIFKYIKNKKNISDEEITNLINTNNDIKNLINNIIENNGISDELANQNNDMINHLKNKIANYTKKFKTLEDYYGITFSKLELGTPRNPQNDDERAARAENEARFKTEKEKKLQELELSKLDRDIVLVNSETDVKKKQQRIAMLIEEAKNANIPEQQRAKYLIQLEQIYNMKDLNNANINYIVGAENMPLTGFVNLPGDNQPTVVKPVRRK